MDKARTDQVGAKREVLQSDQDPARKETNGAASTRKETEKVNARSATADVSIEKVGRRQQR